MDQRHVRFQADCPCCAAGLRYRQAPIGRRNVLLGLGLSALSAALGTDRARAAASAAPRCIDVHHHLSFAEYLEAAGARGVRDPFMKNWTVQKSIDDMDRSGVSTAILSMSMPGVSFTSGPEARQLARKANELAARLGQDHPGRFGSFATIPLTDTEGSLAEIEYALGALEADGICLMTSYGDKWLGDASFHPIFEELNRRKAIVYVHPTAAACCVNLVPRIPVTMIEVSTDTTRTIADLIFSGTAIKFPQIRWIFSHAGGTMPFLSERFVRLPLIDKSLAASVPSGSLELLKSFFYDTAQSANKATLSALATIVPASQILFGTDFPYRTASDHIDGLRNSGVFSQADLENVERNNALRLMPRRA